VQDANGAYLVLDTDNELGRVARPFPLRLILHNSAANEAVLLQRVFVGTRQENLVVSTTESVLDRNLLGAARRVSAAHLPTTRDNVTWSCIGSLSPGNSLTVAVPLAHDAQESNPFLHTYHPDHDNLGPAFQPKLAQGVESYRIDRAIKLNFTAPDATFDGLTGSVVRLGGDYEETITLSGRPNESRVFEARGTFTLTRVTPIDTLTRQ